MHADYIGPSRSKRPPHGKEGRNEAIGRPIYTYNHRSTARRNPRSQSEVRGREEHGLVSEPDSRCAKGNGLRINLRRSKNGGTADAGAVQC